MPRKEKRAAVLFFVAGLLVGGLAGLIGGILLFENRPGLLIVAAAVGALVFSVLGILFKERMLEFFPWY